MVKHSPKEMNQGGTCYACGGMIGGQPFDDEPSDLLDIDDEAPKMAEGGMVDAKKDRIASIMKQIRVKKLQKPE